MAKKARKKMGLRGGGRRAGADAALDAAAIASLPSGAALPMPRRSTTSVWTMRSARPLRRFGWGAMPPTRCTSGL